MISKIKKPVSILLVFMMIVSLFAIVPITASAEVGDFVPESEYLTFTAETAGSSVTLKVNSGGSNLQYDLNGAGLTGYTAGTTITLASEGDSVSFRGNNTTFDYSRHVSITGKVACSGNIMSLRLDDDGMSQGLSNSCFNYMFYGCTGLTAAPELPETMLAENCYKSMFDGCGSLTTAPELPATSLAKECYSNMFYGCTSLTTAPELPATSLAESCYKSMFNGCGSLTTAPELPATSLESDCYNSMFNGCGRLTTAPALPATSLAPYCYSNMFNRCERLTTAPELPATTLERNCYYCMFYGCSSIKLSETQTDEYSIPYSVPSGGNGTEASYALNYMFDRTGGTFKGTPVINKTYYVPAPAQTAVPYMAWDNTAKQLVEKTGNDACADYTVVADDTTAFEDGKWYVVSEDVTVADRITVSGTANLILCDGKTLTASNGITVETDNTLNIFAQSTGESMGKLTAATTSGTVQNAVIGGVGSSDSSVPGNACGTVNIHCGDISTSGYRAYYAKPGAGIGGGGGYNGGDGGTVTIYGGKVIASGGYSNSGNMPGAGIGGGSGASKGGDGGTVTIYGGTVTATGGIIGGNASGIGGDGGTVIIYDGTVEAYGSSGIGGGYGNSNGGNGGNVEIYGGKVTTGYAYVAGIGGGTQNADHGTLTVGRAQLVYGGNSENPTTIIKKINNDYARYRYMTVDTRELADDHEHTFVYTASGNTISATCSVENCEFSGLTPITLTLEAPSPAYDGNPKEAVLSGYPDDAPQGLAAAPTGIVYYTATAPGSTETTGSALSGAPTDAGNFVAQVTWGGETISVPFSVEYSLTINDGTYSDSNFPVYGYNADCYQKSQFVIPASDLTNLQGMTLTEMQFYLSYKASKVWDGTFEVYLGPCDFVLFSNSTFADISEHTKVYTGTLDGTGDTMNVVFDTGYTYTGGNLLVTFFEVEKGAYARANFYGVNDNNLPNYTGIYAYNGSEPTFNSPSGTYFVPKVTIKYSAPEPAPVEVFTGHNITLGGDIGVNFFLDKTAYDNLSGTKTVKFVLDKTEYTGTVRAYDNEKYVVTCDVVAAQMAHTITATLYVDDKAVDTDDYSVQQYAETVFKNPEAYDDKGKPDELKALAKALLNYGAMAQTVFYDSLKEHPALANTVVGNNGYEGVTADQIEGAIKGSAFTVSDVETALGAKFYTSSLIYLSRNTLRLYFTPTTYPGEIPNAGAYAGNLSGYYYYVDAANIPAAELDNQQTFSVNGTEFTFSALDYAKAVVESKMEPEQQNLAKALYLYNKAANAYFDEPAPVENVVDLGTVTEDTVVENGYTITGTLKGDYKISIADGATVTLKDATITCLTTGAAFAGINPVGDATILLEGTNTVMGGYEDYPGVFVPVGKTLTIDGTGSLTALSNGYGCGIGGGYQIASGNIEIKGGNITATGGQNAAGIGSGGNASCGDITINGGTVTANGGVHGAGIGGGGWSASCGTITITGGTVEATGGALGAGIGNGRFSRCGDITIAATVTSVTATKGSNAPNSIGAGFGGSCGTVTIAPGANVTQN